VSPQFLPIILTASGLRCFKRMLIAFSTPPFYTAVVKLPPEITGNPKFFPFFSDAIGAVDSIQINCSPSRPEQENWRNRKGSPTQNCLTACSFTLLFTYFLSRWEGSTADETLFNDDWRRALDRKRWIGWFRGMQGFPWEPDWIGENASYHNGASLYCGRV
jgi:hypothetical protein